jgi:anti-sigma-K factor RskA
MSDNPEERDLLAAEYALGTLDAAARAAVAARLPGDPTLRTEVEAWEWRLAPLLDDVPLVEPAPEVWPRIEAELTRRLGPPKLTVVERPGLWRRVETWRWATAAASLAAAVLLVLLLLPAKPGPDRFVATPAGPQGGPAWFARVAADGAAIDIQPVTVAALPADRSYELWIIPPGATAPRSLGLIDPNTPTRRTLTADVRGGGTLAVSLEPRGGSPTGAPTGPVLHTGTVISPRT